MIEICFSAYSLGLVVYSVLSWMKNPATDGVRMSLARFYEPALSKIQKSVPLMKVGAGFVDVSPIVLLIGLIILRELVLRLLPSGW